MSTKKMAGVSLRTAPYQNELFGLFPFEYVTVNLGFSVSNCYDSTFIQFAVNGESGHTLVTLANETIYLTKEINLNIQSSHKRFASLITMMAFAALTCITACSPKPSTEDSSAQTKALVDQAIADTKKQILAGQAAEKAKQEALVAEEASAKAKQDAAVAQAVAETKREFAAKQQAAAKAQSHKAASAQPAATTPATPAVPATPSAPPATTPKKMVCTTCGVIVSVNEVETEGKGSGLGVVAGGVVGGLLGNQVGNGSGRDLATIAGALGGAFAGNKIEKNSKKAKSYDIAVKMETGEEVVFHQTTLPTVVKGDAVRIENGNVIKK